jgi:hypothetical protein
MTTHLDRFAPIEKLYAVHPLPVQLRCPTIRPVSEHDRLILDLHSVRESDRWRGFTVEVVRR